MKKITTKQIQNRKNKEKISMITAYDYLFSRLFDKNIDIILVGDSLNMSFGGKSDTVSATMDIMIYHTKAVCMGIKSSLVVCDMPFGSYTNKDKALKNAIKVYQETQADAVKIEGGEGKSHIIKELTSNGISVMGHIGLLPQSFRSEGYTIKGKNQDDIKKLIEDAKAVEKAGAFAIVLEGVKEEVAKTITQTINIPTIGIGAGRYTDGQVLVWSDMLGFFEDFKPKFVRQYLQGATIVKDAVKKFDFDIKNSSFPDDNEIY